MRTPHALLLAAVAAAAFAAPGAAQDPPAKAPPPEPQTVVVASKHLQAREALGLLTRLFGESRDLAMAADEHTNALILRGKPERIAEATALLERLDEHARDFKLRRLPADSLPFVAHPVPAGMAEPAAKILRHLYRDAPRVRIEAAAGANAVLVYGPGADQRAIKQLLAELKEAGK